MAAHQVVAQAPARAAAGGGTYRWKVSWTGEVLAEWAGAEVVLAIARKELVSTGFAQGVVTGISVAESPRRTQSRKRLRAPHRLAVALSSRGFWARQVVMALTVTPSEVGDAGNGYPTPHRQMLYRARAIVR
jgi:hypothetical protein